MSGVPVQAICRDTGMCIKAVTAFYCCQWWRLSSPQKSQLAHCGCLIFNTTKRLVFPSLLTVFEIRFAKGMARYSIWSHNMTTFVIQKVTGNNTVHIIANACQGIGCCSSCLASRPNCCRIPSSNTRKWVGFVALEL